MSTAATAVRPKPPIEIKPAAASDPLPSSQINNAETTSLPPSRLLTLPDDAFETVAEYTSLIHFSRTSRGARKEHYKYEISRYQSQPHIVRLYGELSPLPWTQYAETLIRELNQRKMAMTSVTRLDVKIQAAYLDIEINPSRTITQDNVSIDHLLRLRNMILTEKDVQLNAFFDWLAQQEPSPLEACDPGSKFRNSLKPLLPTEKAKKIRIWFKEHGSKLQLNQGSFDTLNPFICPELLEISSLSTNLLSYLFVKIWAKKDWPLLTKLLESTRCLELMNHRGDLGPKRVLLKEIQEKYPEKCKLVFSCLRGRLLQEACTISNPQFFQALLDNLSDEGLHQAVEFALVSVEIYIPSAQQFLQAVLNHPRAQQLRTSTLARVLWVISKKPLFDLGVLAGMVIVDKLFTDNVQAKVLIGAWTGLVTWLSTNEIRSIAKVGSLLLKKPFK